MADLIQDAVSLFLICAFSLWLLLIPICILWLRRPDFLLQRLYNLTFWQTLAAGFFVVAFAGYLAEGFEAVALEEWNIHDDPRSLHIASSYEAFWCFAMVPWFVTGLGNAWLPLADSLGLPENSPAEQQVRAKLSMLWAVGMLGFWPVSWWMTMAYDVQRPPTVIVFLGLLFVQTLVAGALHLREGKDRQLRELV